MMKYPLGITGLILVLAVAARAGDLIPVEDFARYPKMGGLSISPDGESCAFLADVKGHDLLFFADMNTMKPVGFPLGKTVTRNADRWVEDYRWIGPKRVIMRLCYWDFFLDGMAAIDRDGKKWTPISGSVGEARGWNTGGNPEFMAFEVIHDFRDDKHVLMLDRRAAGNQEEWQYPNVVEVNTRDLNSRTVVENPGEVISWSADWHGVVRIGTKHQEGETRLIFREDETSQWRPRSGQLHSSLVVEGFTPDERGIYVSAGDKQHCANLRVLDLASQTLGEPILEEPGYDLNVLSGRVFFAGTALMAPIWLQAGHQLIGYKYFAEGPKVKWFDQGFSGRQAKLDQLLPGTFNLTTSLSDDGQKMIVLAFSDRDPGRYYLYDASKDELRPLATRMPWIKPEQMAKTFPVKFVARDGLEIHGYMTVPVGQKPVNQPVVVLPHEGSWRRGATWGRDIWGFDPLVQMLANRGYVVLQINYRGSSGYGDSFQEKGRYECGGAVQQDIEDVTRWAIAKRIANPKRIAIVGQGFGGYCALHALGHTPDLYCCGISVNGITEWLTLFSEHSDPNQKVLRKFWIKNIGDPSKDKEKLQAISPVNYADKFQTPVLIVQGEDDMLVTPGQARRMVKALRDAGRPVEEVSVADYAHWGGQEKSHIQIFKAIDTFLAAHLGGAAAPAAVAKSEPPAGR